MEVGLWLKKRFSATKEGEHEIGMVIKTKHWESKSPFDFEAEKVPLILPRLSQGLDCFDLVDVKQNELLVTLFIQLANSIPLEGKDINS